MDNILAAAFYGMLAALTCLAAWRSRVAPLQKAALVALASWAISNFLFDRLHPPTLLSANATADSILGISLFFLLRDPSVRRVRTAVSLVYTAMLTAHFGWLLFYRGVSYSPYYATENVLFVLLLASISSGACGAPVSRGNQRGRANSHGGGIYL